MYLILHPHPVFDDRQLIILRCIIDELSLAHMGEAILRSPDTADLDVRKLFRMLGVNSRLQLILECIAMEAIEVVAE